MTTPFETKATPGAMPADEYKAALAALGMTQTGLAAWLGAHSVTGRKWATSGPPGTVAKILKLMVALDVGPEWVDSKINGTRAASRRRV